MSVSPHSSPHTETPVAPRLLPSGARLALSVYRALFPLAFVGMLPSFAKRMLRRGNYRHKFGQRFGIYSRRSMESLSRGGWTWIHAVSVGEMVMGVRLARVMEEAKPGQRILLSTTTSTGFALARQEVKKIREEWRTRSSSVEGREAPAIELIYFPVDFSLITRRILRLLQPRQVILVDKEFWPNLITECYLRRIPVSIVNAMLSPRSERRFLKWRRWTGPFFSMLEKVCVQEPEDVSRWEALGVRRAALECTGSLKFDFIPASGGVGDGSVPHDILARWGLTSAPVLVGGSTFPGEEEVLLDVWRRLRMEYPDLFLVLVPRHVERRGEIVALLDKKGVRYRLRSELREDGQREKVNETSEARRPEVLLVDVTGELRAWYGVASVSFIGKSLKAKGGQNPAEPILAGCPVIIGPWMQNFAILVRQFLAVEGVTEVADRTELEAALRAILTDREIGNAQVRRALAVLKVHEGANKRVAERLLKLQS